jgi:hypothetical protein
LLAATLLVPTLKAKPANWLWELLAAVLLLKENQQTLFRNQFAREGKILFLQGRERGLPPSKIAHFPQQKLGKFQSTPPQLVELLQIGFSLILVDLCLPSGFAGF